MTEKKPSDFDKFQDVYTIVANIPPGKVITYGRISMMVGNLTARRVGYAMRMAPPGLPAHRVVNSTGKLSPEYVFGGEDAQRAILKKEGVVFTAAGNIDMKKSLWEMNE
ncbi:MGMT family protein [Methanimicrococcus sp. OttesenSCG-928-J09]|nr:MGMT family protein [Methanimicrococcus sp. OttesenSCG-928-J09]